MLLPTFISSVYPKISKPNKVVEWDTKTGLIQFVRRTKLFVSVTGGAILKVALKT